MIVERTVIDTGRVPSAGDLVLGQGAPAEVLYAGAVDMNSAVGLRWTVTAETLDGDERFVAHAAAVIDADPDLVVYR
jgi:hypothetical protein